MRAALAGDVDAAGGGAGDGLDAAGAGDVDDVQSAAGLLREGDRALDGLDLVHRGFRSKKYLCTQKF